MISTLHMYLLHFIYYTFLVWGIEYILSNFQIDQFWPTVVIVGLILTVVNSIIKPLLEYILIPINILSFGLFGLILNFTISLYIGNTFAGFNVKSLETTFLISVLITLGAKIAHLAFDKNQSDGLE